MAFNKIDNKDVSVQVESNKIDVWVPNGTAQKSNAVNRTYIFGEEMSMVFSTKNTVKFRTNTEGTNWEYYLSQINKSEALYTIGREPGQTSSFDKSLVLGPILFQNRMPIPVQPGALVKLSGKFSLNAPSLSQIDEDGNVTFLIMRVDLWGIYEEEDSDGALEEKALNIYNYSSPRISRQNRPNSQFIDAQYMQEFNLNELSDIVIPQGIFKLFMTISFVASNTGAYITNEYYLSPSMSLNTAPDGVVVGGAISNVRTIASFPIADPLKIEVKNNPLVEEVVESTLSSTGFAFKNRAIFENVFPIFNKFVVSNNGFEDDLFGWTNSSGTSAISTSEKFIGKKSLRVTMNNTLTNIKKNQSFTVVSGERYLVECRVKTTSIVGSGSIKLIASFKSSSGSETLVILSDKNITNVTGDWIVLSGWSKAPINVTSLEFYVQFTTGMTSGFVYLDDFNLYHLENDNVLKYFGSNLTGASIEVYEWNGSRGQLIVSDSCSASQVKDILVGSTTGMIEVVKPGAITYADMGMHKTSNQIINQSVYSKITNFVKRSDMPGTVITNNSLIVQTTGEVIFSMYLDFFGDKGSYLKKIAVYKNGVLLKEFTSSLNLSGLSGQTEKFSVTAGDIIEFYAYSGSPIADQRNISDASHFEMQYVNVVQSGNDFYIESVLARNKDELDYVQNNIEYIEFLDIIDEVVSIKTDKSEADAGLITITFSSNTLDPRYSNVLQVGKKIRILGRHYNEFETKPQSWVGDSEYEEICRGDIKRIEVVYTRDNEPQLVVTAQDVYQELDSVKIGVAFDEFDEYGYILNSLGIEVFINATNWTGNKTSIEGISSNPSIYNENLTIVDALIMTRNSQKKYLYINSKNQLIIKDELSDEIKFTITDGLMPGDFSMSDITLGIDTDAIINNIELEENYFDYSDFTERQMDQSKIPNLFTKIETKTKKTNYGDIESIKNYGTKSKKFEVIRGSGKYEDIIGNNLGQSFENWANDIISYNSLPLIKLTEINTPIKNSLIIKKLSSLEVLDLIRISYQGDNYLLRVKKISHEIRAGKWIAKFQFYPNVDQSYW